MTTKAIFVLDQPQSCGDCPISCGGGQLKCPLIKMPDKLPFSKKKNYDSGYNDGWNDFIKMCEENLEWSKTK